MSQKTADVFQRAALDGRSDPVRRDGDIVNAFSVDVEDYFQVGAFERIVRRQDWDHFEQRVDSNTRKLLELFSRHEVSATLFILGWVAERWPQLVRDILSAGHELALHGYDHQRVTTLSPEEFRADIRRAKQIVENLSGVEVVGYRAPNYSIVEDTLWALEILAEEGFLYDSSIFPIRHDHYGIPSAPRFPWRVAGKNDSGLVEFPISTLRIAGVNLPFVGGGYLRHVPFALSRWGIRRLNTVEHEPAIVYIHPWEIDPDQPRIAAPRLTRLRHYYNLDRTESRLDALFAEFHFSTVREVLGL